MSPMQTVLVMIVLGLISVSVHDEIGVGASSEKTKTSRLEDGSLSNYIIQLQHPEEEGLLFNSLEELSNWYASFLPNTNSRIVHAYQHALTGFSAMLTAGEAEAMRSKAGVLAVHPEKILQLHTTHSPSFLGLTNNNMHGSSAWRQSHYGKGIIIGMLDSGITPSHPSFNDSGMSPPPSKWKGRCAFSPCNNKLIGGRILVNGSNEDGAPLSDEVGHGTHTASAAAGNFVCDANIFGNALGTASGMAPMAHLAIYKICGNRGCHAGDVVAGIDAAIQDGVDVISASLGTGTPIPLQYDVVAIATFRAMQKGIFISASAGNGGPYTGSVENVYPWVLTVGASTMDRVLKATAHLGNGLSLDGETLLQPNQSTPVTSLVYSGMIISIESSNLCATGTLHGFDLTGKIVICDSGGFERDVSKAQEVKRRGGIAMIIMNAKDAYDNIFILEGGEGSTVILGGGDENVVIPVLRLNYVAGLQLMEYMYSTTNPEAHITFHGTVYVNGNGNGIPSSPSVAYFSSRGPNPLEPDEVMKPDILGPGVNILAARATSSSDDSNSRLMFRMEFGTSISCSHLSGIVALLKNSHPDWSPAAIKSAIMTSADRINRIGEPITDQTSILSASALGMGAGHVNPTKALDPGLVYDMTADDYIPYLCGREGVDVGSMIGRKVNCSAMSYITGSQLNYPSFSGLLLHNNDTKTYTRTVTNVGPSFSSYHVVVTPPDGVIVSVKPLKLNFRKRKQKKTYKVIFHRLSAKNPPFTDGYLRWISHLHIVTSPIFILFTNKTLL